MWRSLATTESNNKWQGQTKPCDKTKGKKSYVSYLLCKRVAEVSSY